MDSEIQQHDFGVVHSSWSSRTIKNCTIENPVSFTIEIAPKTRFIINARHQIFPVHIESKSTDGISYGLFLNGKKIYKHKYCFKGIIETKKGTKVSYNFVNQ